MPATSRVRVVWILALLLLAAPAFWLTPQPGHGWGGDFSVYVWQARNLAEGKPIFDSSFVVTPEAALHQPAAYPPITSLLLAPVYRTFGLDYLAMKRVLALATWLSLPIWFLLGTKSGLPDGIGFLAALTFGWSSALAPVLDSVVGDGVYLLTSSLALLGIYAVEDSGWVDRKPVTAAVAVGFPILLSVGTRSVGIALVAAVGLNEAARVVRMRRLPPFSVLLGTLLAIGIAAYQFVVFDSARQYGSQFLLQADAFREAVGVYLRSPASLWSGSPTPLRYALAGLTVVLAGAAFLRPWRLAQWYVVTLVSILVFYSVADSRYILPVLPLVLFLAAQTALAWGGKVMPQSAKSPAAAFFVLAALAGILNLLRLPGPVSDQMTRPLFQEMVAFLRMTEPDTQILSWNPRVFALYTDRPSALGPQEVGAPWETYPPADRRLLIRYVEGPDVAAVDAAAKRLNSPVVFQNAEFTVFELPQELR